MEQSCDVIHEIPAGRPEKLRLTIRHSNNSKTQCPDLFTVPQESNSGIVRVSLDSSCGTRLLELDQHQAKALHPNVQRSAIKGLWCPTATGPDYPKMSVTTRMLKGWAFLSVLGFFHHGLLAELEWDPVNGWQHLGDRARTFIGDSTEFEQIRDTMNLAREAQERGKHKTALKMYRRVWDRHPGSVFAPEALYQTAQVEYKDRAYRCAFNSLTTIILGYPDYDKYDQVVRQQFSIATDLYDGKRASYIWGVLPGFKGYDRAIVMYETLVSNAPYNDYAPLALMKAAELHIQLDNDIYALDALDRLINNYPTSMLAGDAYLLLAQTFAGLVDGPEYDQGATREAISYFEDFLILFPDHPKVKEGEDGLAKMKSVEAQSQIVKGDFYYYRWKDLRAAKVFYNEAITIAPESPEAKVAKKMIARIDARVEEMGAGAGINTNTLVPTSDNEGVKDPTNF